jgi:hypothetical protein
MSCIEESVPLPRVRFNPVSFWKESRGFTGGKLIPGRPHAFLDRQQEIRRFQLMASASALLKFSREACEGAWRPPSFFETD